MMTGSEAEWARTVTSFGGLNALTSRLNHVIKEG